MSERKNENHYNSAANHACCLTGDLMDQLNVSNAVRMMINAMK